MNTNQNYREKVRAALLEQRKNYGGSDKPFAKSYGLDAAIYSRLKSGETENIISDIKWLEIGFKLGVTNGISNWKIVKTSVYNQIEEALWACKKSQRSMIMADCNGIGKTEVAKSIIKNMRNAFYIDCSQATDRRSLIKAIASAIGIDNKGTYNQVFEKVKYYINVLGDSLFVLDEFGDLSYPAFLMIKSLWNGTESRASWFAMGAQALQNKIEKGIDRQKIGFAEVFDRFSGEIISIVPTSPQQKLEFYRHLLTEVATANLIDHSKIEKAVRKCLVSVDSIKSLRVLRTIIELDNEKAQAA